MGCAQFTKPLMVQQGGITASERRRESASVHVYPRRAMFVSVLWCFFSLQSTIVCVCVHTHVA